MHLYVNSFTFFSAGLLKLKRIKPGMLVRLKSRNIFKILTSQPKSIPMFLWCDHMARILLCLFEGCCKRMTDESCWQKLSPVQQSVVAVHLLYHILICFLLCPPTSQNSVATPKSKTFYPQEKLNSGFAKGKINCYMQTLWLDSSMIYLFFSFSALFFFMLIFYAMVLAGIISMYVFFTEVWVKISCSFWIILYANSWLLIFLQGVWHLKDKIVTGVCLTEFEIQRISHSLAISFLTIALFVLSQLRSHTYIAIHI